MQCFNHEYVFAESAAESALATALQREVEAQLQAVGAVPEPTTRIVALVAMYQRPDSIAGIEMLTVQPQNPAALAQILKRAVTNLTTERSLRQAIRVIGEAGDEVSREVRGMHEEHTYMAAMT